MTLKEKIEEMLNASDDELVQILANIIISSAKDLMDRMIFYTEVGAIAGIKEASGLPKTTVNRLISGEFENSRFHNYDSKQLKYLSNDLDRLEALSSFCSEEHCKSALGELLALRIAKILTSLSCTYSCSESSLLNDLSETTTKLDCDINNPDEWLFQPTGSDIVDQLIDDLIGRYNPANDEEDDDDDEDFESSTFSRFSSRKKKKKKGILETWWDTPEDSQDETPSEPKILGTPSSSTPVSTLRNFAELIDDILKSVSSTRCYNAPYKGQVSAAITLNAENVSAFETMFKRTFNTHTNNVTIEVTIDDSVDDNCTSYGQYTELSILEQNMLTSLGVPISATFIISVLAELFMLSNPDEVFNTITIRSSRSSRKIDDRYTSYGDQMYEIYAGIKTLCDSPAVVSIEAYHGLNRKDLLTAAYVAIISYNIEHKYGEKKAGKIGKRFDPARNVNVLTCKDIAERNRKHLSDD